MKNPCSLLLLTLFLCPYAVPAQAPSLIRLTGERAVARGRPVTRGVADSMYTFIDSALAFRIKVPQKKVFKNPVKNTPDSKVLSQLYYCSDEKEGTNYVFGVNSLPPNLMADNDSVYFAELRKNMATNFSRLFEDSSYFSKGYIVMELCGKMKNDEKQSAYRFFARGNRWYLLYANFPMTGATAKVKEYFQSFTILDPPARPWHRYSTPDSSMTTWAPAPLVSYPTDPVAQPLVSLHYASFDSLRANGYTIVRYSLSPFYWSLSDSAFWRERISLNIWENDSLVYVKRVSNGEARGLEWMKVVRNSRMYQRKRVLINGDELYSLYSCALRDEILSPDANRFYEDFRFTKLPVKSHFFEAKEGALLDALFGPDPRAASQALAYVTQAPFQKKDLPRLQELVLKRPDPRGQLQPEKVNTAIASCITALNDSSSFRFAAAHYAGLPESDNFIKKNLLRIMSDFPSTTHYAEMAALLHASPPQGLSLFFFEKLKANPHETAHIMPQLLFLAADSFCRPYLINLAATLADSNLLPATVLHSYEPSLLRYAEYRIGVLSSDVGSPLTFDNSLINLLGLLNSPRGNAALTEYFETEFTKLRVKAFAALFRNGKQPATAIQSLAADKATRAVLYRILQKAGKSSLFPPAFRTQQLYSESVVYAKVMETAVEAPSSIDFLSTKLIDSDAGIKRFFFYKIRKENYYLLACAGPFGQDLRQVEFPGTRAILDNQHIFDPAHAEDQMSRLMAMLK